jgi:hypothetical protein
MGNTQIADLRRRIVTGEYVVEPLRIADILLRGRNLRLRLQTECSNPDRGRDPSVKRTLGGSAGTA